MNARLTIRLLGVLAITSSASRAISVEPPPLPTPDSGPAQSTVPLNESLSNLARRIVVESVPKQFEEQKNWGETKKIVNGLRIKDDGDGLKIRKHTAEVKNGLWKQYQAELTDPEHQLEIRVENLRQTGPGQSVFQIFISARLHGEARLEQWKDGVKLFNVNAQAVSKIEARLDCEMAWTWKAGGALGQFSVEPKVTGAQINLDEFELDKLSKIEGWPARELGKDFKDVIAKKLHDEEPKLVEKLNKAIQKRQERLRFSPDDMVAGGLSKLQSLFNPSAEKKSATK